MQRHTWKIHGEGDGGIGKRSSSSNFAASSSIQGTEGVSEGDVEADADVLLRCGVCPNGDTTEGQNGAEGNSGSEAEAEIEVK
jgi:hypothetical protein